MGIQGGAMGILHGGMGIREPFSSLRNRASHFLRLTPTPKYDLLSPKGDTR